MNKYQKAFLVLREHATFETVDELIVMKELVEKETPRKVKTTGHYQKCPRCDNIFFDELIGYCSCCGQKIDWGEDDE